MPRREDRRRQRNTRNLLILAAVGLAWFIWYMNRITLEDYIVSGEELRQAPRAESDVGLLWSDLAKLLPPITLQSLEQLPNSGGPISESAEAALKKCYALLAKGDPWTAETACEEAVLNAGNDPRAYVGRAYSRLPKPTIKPARDDFNIACRLGIPEACVWADKLPLQ